MVPAALILFTSFLQGCVSGYAHHGNQWSYIAYPWGAWRQEYPMPAVDAASFHQIIGDYGEYGADIHHVYHESNLIEGADPASFVDINGECWKDKSKVYWEGCPIQGADPRTFVVLKDGWFKDARRAYNGAFSSMQVRDPSSFESINGDWARDSKAYYFGGYYANAEAGEVVGADYSTFHILKGAFARDRKNIYWGSMAIKNADLGSFEVGGGQHLQAKDRFRYYEFGKPVAKQEWASSPWR